ncbi:unnamed protein product, partial [marine sediment metagenome]
DGKLVTPASYNNILTGITRNTVMELAQNELSVETIERQVDRSELYMAEEVNLLLFAVPVAPDALKNGSAVVNAVGHNPYPGFG